MFNLCTQYLIIIYLGKQEIQNNFESGAPLNYLHAQLSSL